MSYASPQELIERFGEQELLQLTDQGGRGIIDSAALDRALADADRVIDSYLRARYTLPLDAGVIAASGLALAAANIARYVLMGTQAPEEVRDRYRDALAWLKDVQAGRASLGAEDPAAPTGPGRIRTAEPQSGFDWDSY
ncbi:MAG: DUF1320 domain-containing protein [Gammaproteobacteria bacterium]|nr:DUF1320 domain-containing protein [Gammaproteobacteria bacterium]